VFGSFLGHRAGFPNPAIDSFTVGKDLPHIPRIPHAAALDSVRAGPAPICGWLTTITRLNPLTYAVASFREAVFAALICRRREPATRPA